MEETSLKINIDSQSIEDCKLEFNNNYSDFFYTSVFAISTSDWSIYEFVNASNELIVDETYC